MHFLRKIHIQVFRGFLGLICAAIIINSFKNHSFSEIYPILFSAPLIITAHSFFILKEKIGPRRLIAVLIGFVGVLIVARPGTIHFTFSLFLLIIGAIILAINVSLIRIYASNQSSIAFAFYGFSVGLIVSSLITTQFYVPLKNNDIYIFFLCGIIGITGMILPGLSGSFILILLGNYELLLVKAVTDINVIILSKRNTFPSIFLSLLY